MQKAVDSLTPGGGPSFASGLSDSSSGLAAGIAALSKLLQESPNPEISSRLSAALERMEEAATHLQGAAKQLNEKTPQSSLVDTQAAEVVKWFSWTPQRAARFSEMLSYFCSLPATGGVACSAAAEQLSWIAGVQPELREVEAEKYLRNAAKVGVLTQVTDDQGRQLYSLSDQARDWVRLGSFTEPFGIAGEAASEQGS